MMTYTAETMAAMAGSALASDPPPTEAQIDMFLHGLSAAFAVPAEVAAEARRLIHARLRIRMELGETLIRPEGHKPWLDGRKASLKPFYWPRYSQMLLNSGWPRPVLGTLDQATDTLLDLLGNPESQTPWRRRGLVVGDVQSGKTATYAGLICKAADAGYRMVILLTGILENVRRQTQERLDTSFIGFDSSTFFEAGRLRRKQHVGVGLLDSRRDGIVFTSRDQDFRRSAVSALNISLNSVHEPVLVVTKKNKKILEHLANWLIGRNADQYGHIDLPLLLIDDEADNASVNTKPNPGETTAINQAIRNLLQLFRRSSYVGFTATPFANIFIDPSTTDSMLGDDLFPADFIHVLKPPNNYIGMQNLFGGVAGGAEDEDEEGGTIRLVEDADLWLPARHGKNHPPQPLPESLRTAIRVFLLACAIRDLRLAAGTEGKGGGIHRSMLVNVSRFTAVQNWVAELIHVELDEAKTEIRLHGARPPGEAEAQSRFIGLLRGTFEAEYGACGFSWVAVLAALLDAIAPIRVQPVNQVTGARSLDYGVAREPPGVRVIAVGGNTLSRGLTLEGLSTSYFLRNSRAYDTLLQMGRWFGYRVGYDDLCRLWLTDEAASWYRHITEATAELKRDFSRMARRKATPREFGLKVRTHTDTLLITAKNKMASGMDMDVHVDISVAGRGLESSRLYSDRRHNEDNLALLERFFTRLCEYHGMPQSSAFPGAVLWPRVSPLAIADLLEQFAVHYLNHDFQGDSVAAYLREEAGKGPHASPDWTVAIMTGGSGGQLSLPSLPNIEIGRAERRVKPGDGYSLFISGKSARVGGRLDPRHAFTVEEWNAAFPAEKPENEGDIRQQMARPLLLIYLLKGTETANTGDTKTRIPYLGGLVLPAVGLHFPADTTTGGKSSPGRTVRYRLNRVAQEQLLPLMEDDDDLPDKADDDD